MRRRLLVAAGLVLAISAVGLAAGGAYAYVWDRGNADVLAPGIRIGGVDVGGLHLADARALLAARLVQPLERPVTLDAAGRRFAAAPQRLGVRVHLDAMLARALHESRKGGFVHRVLRALRGTRLAVSVPLRAGVSHAAVGALVARVASSVDRPPRPARVVASLRGLRVVPQRDGVAVRREALERELSRALLHAGTRRLSVPTRTVRPRWTRANIARRYPAFIVVDRSAFRLRLYRHLKLYRTYTVAVGMAGLATPAGLYSIDDKQIDPWWHVPRSAWAGSLAGQAIPPGPQDPIKARWMGFWDGAGIHGTDELSSIGSAASHGCIRMAIPDVIELYSLVPLHTPIYVG